MPAPQAPVAFLLHLADSALVLGQRNAEWCGHGPVLEEDIAMANISLDLIGQARMLYQHAAQQLGGNTTEDSLAYWRDAPQFRNHSICELPHRSAFAPGVATERDYAVTIARNFLCSSFSLLQWQALENASDAQLAAIAAKSVKEVRYHLRHSTDWLLRMGGGTAESGARMQAALDFLMPYTQEFWLPLEIPSATNLVAANAHYISLAGTFASEWQTQVAAGVAQAGLQLTTASGYLTQGKNGQHTEHLSYLLAEMQSLARAHPGAQW